MIPFNKPYLSGKEVHYLYEAVHSGQISGNGIYTKKCHSFFENRFNFNKTLLTTSCTDALEMCALLLNIQPGDEIIIPSYTFVSSALAFIRQGAKIVFVDSKKDHPGINENLIESLITDKTRAIVPVHYAGIACDMDKIMQLADQFNLMVVEDAAQAIDNYYKGQVLGGIGHLGCYSFHETKNLQCGEGGLLIINDKKLIKRAEILWEKGTNRAEFFRGEINKYGWVDTGSSFLPSELNSSFLFAQLENIDLIQSKRKDIWNRYYEALTPLHNSGKIALPKIPNYTEQNGHLFYFTCKTPDIRKELIGFLRKHDIHAVFHYQSLHLSDYYKDKHDNRLLPEAMKYSDCLIRLPLFFELTLEQQNYIINKTILFFNSK
ncbi:dTDP-4-amino-4,6-dideoxygalactose transaminase [Carboxylicivirga sp. N1Y90]|uniref:dTDP-4-amino-4,6-dideoxygalactose transaminase n=1 Tax=Carboxylicivirga fragile TaxID=3417571 RepID=UPI003D34ED1E|nr:dTDP-4-amino-4,6-dideoxygalactose transaminase [Marinilabiliaceae bacterium N1Y90]